MRRQRSILSAPASRRGNAILAVLSVVATVAVFVVALLGSTVTSSQQTSRQVDEFRVETVAETASSLAVSQIWSGFENYVNGGPMRPVDFRLYMDSLGMPDQLTVNAEKDNSFQYAGETGLEGEGGYNWVDLSNLVSLPVDENGRMEMDGVFIESLEGHRVDEAGASLIVVRATAVGGSGNATRNGTQIRRQIRQSYAVEPPDWEGLQYAMLANNLNCVLCHAEIDNAQRFFNEDPLLANSFSRVKMGSMESFHIREDPESLIAGTLYLGGSAVKGEGENIEHWGDISLESGIFDHEGLLQEDAWGDLLTESMSPASAADPSPLENLYVDYFSQDADYQVDGYMPETFPPPFPDDGGIDPETGARVDEQAGNRILDEEEFYAAVAGSAGTVSGGTISVIDPKQKVTNAKKYSDMLKGNTDGLQGIVADSHVYMKGTADDPIILNGDLAIDGDLIISGYVKGKGSLKVSGNVYAPSDIKYLDGELGDGRTFGVAADGGENTLGISSGGNIVMGDFYTPAFGEGKEADGKSSGGFNFIMEELAAFNRMEWMKTQPTLPGKREYKKTGEEVIENKIMEKVKETYWVDEPTYKWEWQGDYWTKKLYKTVTKNNGKPAPYYEEWTEAVQIGTEQRKKYVKVQTGTKNVKKTRWVETGNFTIEEETKEIWEWVTEQHPNPNYQGADYVPRLYNFEYQRHVFAANKEGYYDPEANVWMGPELVGKWSNSKLTTSSPNSSSSKLMNPSDTQRAVVATVGPDKNWIKSTYLKDLIRDELKERDEDTPIEVDAMLYSNNSIFGIMPGREGSGSNGVLQINGGIIAADIGLLAPNGFQLNWDSRGSDMVEVFSDTRLAIRRRLWTQVQ